MLVVSPLRSSNHEREEEILGNSTIFTLETDQEISSGDLFDCIDFDDIFIDDGDLLPDLEMEADVLAKLPASTAGGGEECNMDYIWVSSEELEEILLKEDEEDKKGAAKEEITSKNTSEEVLMEDPSWKETHEGGKLMFQSKESKDLQGKKKLKVDWTPELHRRFVQAVEQLGVDKAVPSRILELMGIDCLTRHNVASHLQKYRKHLQAREAKAASWSKYCGKGGINDHHRQGGNYSCKQIKDNQNKMCTWVGSVAPTMHMGIPQNFRTLHVWGHPSSNHHQSIHLWPKHHHPLHPRPYPPWVPPPPPPSPGPRPASYWLPRPAGQPHQVPQALTPAGTLCFPQPLTTMRLPSTFPTVSSIPPRAMCKASQVQSINGVPNGQQYSDVHHPLMVDSHPSKECIDAAIGDVLSKPWLPLPLGLKPPSMESVLGELQHQGVSKIPATCA